MYLPYLNTTQISAKSEGKCLKVSLAKFCSEWDEHDEKLARPTSDLTCKYEWVSGFFEAYIQL